jgi:hypothetical protein
MQKNKLFFVLLSTVFFQAVAPFYAIANNKNKDSFVILCTANGFEKVYTDGTGKIETDKKGAHCPFCLLSFIDDDSSDDIILYSFVFLNNKQQAVQPPNNNNKALLRFAMMPIGIRAPPRYPI